MVFLDIGIAFEVEDAMELIDFAGGASWPQYAASTVLVVFLIYLVYIGFFND